MYPPKGFSQTEPGPSADHQPTLSESPQSFVTHASCKSSTVVNTSSVLQQAQQGLQALKPHIKSYVPPDTHPIYWIQSAATAMVAANSHYCQICFDEIPQKDKAVTTFCSWKCPAVFCDTCLVHQLSVALQVGYIGALPRVRCPICLVLVNKSQWSKYVDASTMTTDKQWPLLERYDALCKQACMFRTPCCHSSTYVHMPDAIDPATATAPGTLTLPKSQVAALRKKCRRFGRHKITGRDLVNYLTDTFPDDVKRDAVFEGVLERLMDEERRATLLLSYHAVYRVVVTSCCGWRTCFNCKRASPDEDEGCECEQEEDEFDERTDLVQCRSCRAMLVKVDGCDHVVCMCGFSMDWLDELRFRDQLKKKLLPVDPFDTTGFEEWVSWHNKLVGLFDDLQVSARVKMQLKFLAKSHPQFVPTLRRFIWWRRFRRLRRSKLTEEAVRAKYMDRVLVPLLQHALIKRVVQKRMRKSVLTELVPAVRLRFVNRELAKQKPKLKRFISTVVTQCRCKRVQQQIQHTFFWKRYAQNHEDEQKQIESEENAFLTSFNVCSAEIVA